MNADLQRGELETTDCQLQPLSHETGSDMFDVALIARDGQWRSACRFEFPELPILSRVKRSNRAPSAPFRIRHDGEQNPSWTFRSALSARDQES
jgi:hypothetical protein